jgi:hypothetical protein
MDCTGSMGSHIQQAKQNINMIVETIVAKEQADVRLALIEYRDHPPQDFTEFITRVLDFTSSVREMKERLDECSPRGGGDTPEAVADALHDLIKLNWREDAAKICVFISDAPPHGLGTPADGFPTGCPCGLDPMVTVRELAAKGVAVYTVGCEPSITPYRDWFMAISHITGGQYVPLASANLLPQVIIGGAQEEISLQLLMAQVNADVVAEMGAQPEGSVRQAAVEERVYKNLKARGQNAKRLKPTVGEMPGVSADARHYSEMGDMKAVSEKYKKASSSSADFAFAASAPFAFGASAAAPFPTSVPGAPSSRYMTRGSITQMAAPHGAPPAAGGDGGASSDYMVDEVEVTPTQVSRMVQKALYKNNLKSKCAKEDL